MTGVNYPILHYRRIKRDDGVSGFTATAEIVAEFVIGPSTWSIFLFSGELYSWPKEGKS